MTKAELREMIWRRLEEEGVVRFPGSWGRIPNFEGAGEAACPGHAALDARVRL